jgi:hypothetical protein
MWRRQIIRNWRAVLSTKVAFVKNCSLLRIQQAVNGESADVHDRGGPVGARV